MKQFFKMMFASALGVFVAVGLISIVFVFTLIGIATSMSSTPDYTPKSNTVYKLTLDGSLSDNIQENPIAMLLGETEKALNDYNTLLIENPEHQEALYCRGLLYIQLQNYMWAEQDFDKILEVNEKSVRARLGHAILEKMRGNYDESERIFNYLISEMPRDWILYEGRADLYFMMGKNARAMADIEKVFTESEPTANLYVLRGKIKLAQYEKERAALDFKKAESMGYNKEVIKELLKLTMNN